MMVLNNLGYHTDCIARKFEGEFIEKDSYIVLRMPTNPTYYWGNLLLFKDEPKPDDYDKWISAHLLEFGEEAGHVTFGWESQKVGNIDRFIQNGFTLDSGSVLILKNLTQNISQAVDMRIREIVSDEDWEAVLKLQILVSEGENPSPGFVEFKTRSFETYRKLSEERCGAWWGAYIGDTLVGDMGLYFDDQFETGRFQSVETHPDYRRKGICSTLLHAVVSHSTNKHPKAKLVIGTDVNSDAEKIYLKLGFKKHQLQYGVCLERPLNRSSIHENGSE